MNKDEKQEVTEIVTSNGLEVLDENEEVVLSVLKFQKPYIFEGDTYTEIDLTGLENMTAKDMIAVNKLLEKSGFFSLTPELSLEYACEITARATKLPVELFRRLPMREAMKLKNRVTGFLYGAD